MSMDPMFSTEQFEKGLAVRREVLGSEYGLKELVREADVEWGRVFGERPRFETDGCPAAPDDPYTAESVRTALTQLVGGLTAGEACRVRQCSLPDQSPQQTGGA